MVHLLPLWDTTSIPHSLMLSPNSVLGLFQRKLYIFPLGHLIGNGLQFHFFAGLVYLSTKSITPATRSTVTICNLWNLGSTPIPSILTATKLK